MTVYDISLQGIIGALGLAGLANAVMFARGVISKTEGDITCKDGTCIKLSKTPYYRVFWVPNWVLGIPYYVVTILAALTSNSTLVVLATLGAIITFFLTFYLVWALAVKLRVICPLCYVAHGINVVLFIVWMWAWSHAF